MADGPAAVLRRLLDGVRTGGVVAFQEMDMGAVTWEPDCPLLAAAGDRIVQTFVRAGIDHRTGLKLALMERTGVATAAEVGVDTLAARLREEVVAADATVVPPPLIGAWTRKPAR